MNTSTTDHTEHLERLYTGNLTKRTALWVRIQERRTVNRAWDHSHNSDAETLRVLDDAGLILSRRILQAAGLDVDAIEADVIARCADDAPQF